LFLIPDKSEIVSTKLETNSKFKIQMTETTSMFFLVLF